MRHPCNQPSDTQECVQPCRADVEVSKHMNHLLKAPFCVHPKTGRVCVPMDPQQAEAFDPMTVPTVGAVHVVNSVYP